MKKYLFLLILALVFIPQSVFSQTRVEEQISITFSPKVPGPNESVSVYIESYQIDLNKSNISWFVDGEVITTGLGLKEFFFTTKNVGNTTRLSVLVTKQNGQIVRKNYSITPGEVNLYYEAETYTPPFYKGKSEYAKQSRIKIMAIPNFSDGSGGTIPSSEIVYRWKINGDIDDKGSGIGKDTYYYQGGLISGTLDVAVEASPASSNQIAVVTETINTVDPTILVYEKNPIYGIIYGQIVDDNLTLEREEIELEVVPYNFSNDILRVGNFKWILNGSEVKNFQSENIVFRRVDNNPSSNNVIIEIQHPNKILQTLRHNFKLNFGEDGLNFNF
jgi:hypothetical protein